MLGGRRWSGRSGRRECRIGLDWVGKRCGGEEYICTMTCMNCIALIPLLIGFAWVGWMTLIFVSYRGVFCGWLIGRLSAFVFVFVCIGDLV